MLWDIRWWCVVLGSCTTQWPMTMTLLSPAVRWNCYLCGNPIGPRDSWHNVYSSSSQTQWTRPWVDWGHIGWSIERVLEGNRNWLHPRRLEQHIWVTWLVMITRTNGSLSNAVGYSYNLLFACTVVCLSTAGTSTISTVTRATNIQWNTSW